MRFILIGISLALCINSCAAAKKQVKYKKNIASTKKGAVSSDVLPSYILIDYNSDLILEEKDIHRRIPPASMTKLFTIYVLFSEIKAGRVSLDDEFTISKNAHNPEGSKSFLKQGDTIKIEDLIRSILVHSGNDSCIVLAEGLAGSVEKFAVLMNKVAKQIGANNSHFVTPNGLPDPNHYSTVYDIALISKRLISDFPEFYKYFSEKELEVNGIRQPNRNRLLWKNIGVDGLKTGHLYSSGFGLAASAKKDNTRMISVVHGYKSERERDTVSENFLTYGLRTVATYQIGKPGYPLVKADVWLGNKEIINLAPAEDIKVSTIKGNGNKFKVYAKFQSPIPAPINKGEHIADLIIETAEADPKIYKLYATENVDQLEPFARAASALKSMLFGNVKK